MKIFTTAYLVGSIFLAPVTANAAESVKGLLVAALNAPDGKASSSISGSEADTIHAVTGATDPVKGEASVIKRFESEPNCGRLALKLTQPNTPTKDGKKLDYFMKYELNICKDGTPPSVGVNIGAPDGGVIKP